MSVHVYHITIEQLYDRVKNTLDKYGINMTEWLYSDRYDWYEDPTWELTDLHLMTADTLKKYVERECNG